MDTPSLDGKGWRRLQDQRGMSAMHDLAEWIEEHTAPLPMRWRARPGEQALVMSVATITSGVLIIEHQIVMVHALPGAPVHPPEDVIDRREVRMTKPVRVDPKGWLTGRWDVLRPPPFWVQPELRLP